MISSYGTTLDQDEALLAHVEANPSEYFWMYQFVLIYRIGQKEILREQLYLAAILLKALETYGGDREVFNSETKHLRETTMSMHDYFTYDLN